MSEELERIRRRYRHATDLEGVTAILGTGDGRLYLEPGVDTSRVWVRFRQADGYMVETVARIETTLAVQLGAPVILGVSKQDGALIVRQADYVQQRALGYNPGLNNPADNALYGFVGQNRITTLLCHSLATPSVADTDVAVRSFFYIRNGTAHLFNGDTISLAATIAGISSGKHLLAGIFLENDDTLGVYTSTEQTTALALDLTDVQECIDGAPDDAIAVWFWRLYNGQTTISNRAYARGGDDFLDGRMIVTPQQVRSALDIILTDGNGDVLTDSDGNVLTE